MVDTHAHLGMCEPDDAELVAAARAAGVRRILTVGIDPEASLEAVAAAEHFEEVYAAVGCHPNSAGEFDEAAAGEIERLAAHPKVRAVGETGLDYYRDRAPRRDQEAAFSAQIEIARRASLPLVVHMRDSTGDTFRTLAREADGVEVILHCFSAPPGRVAEAAERGWYCSFAGNVTYPKAGELREAAGLVPEDRLLVETDAPFLSPQLVRGRPNQPANVAVTAAALARARGLAGDELEALVEANAARVLGW